MLENEKSQVITSQAALYSLDHCPLVGEFCLLPPFETNEENTLFVDETIRDGFQIYTQNSAREECERHALNLEQNGFVKYSVKNGSLSRVGVTSLRMSLHYYV